MKKAPRKKTYLVFRRYMSGICTACVLVTIAGGFLSDASFTEITLRAIQVWAGIALAQWVLVKTWSAWETTNSSESAKPR